MLYEDSVLGVIVLAKLGLNQFTADDLRLLEIYASIAAQAMANADATEQLHAQSEALARQVSSQRELLRVTESILGTLDTTVVLQQIADSLNTLLPFDNICVDVYDDDAGTLRPIFSHGIHADRYLAATIPAGAGIGNVVLHTGEAELIQDQLVDERVLDFAGTGRIAGARIVAPLRRADGVTGVLTVERLGAESGFSDDEFELVKLFAAHVSIALRNAAQHRAVELTRRSPDRPVESRRPDRAPGAPRRAPRAVRHADGRSRPVQGIQRPERSSGRQRHAPACRRPLARILPRQ
jgi:GAF domain-containing protein